MLLRQLKFEKKLLFQRDEMSIINVVTVRGGVGWGGGLGAGGGEVFP